jgi:amino acid transporter
MAASGTPHAGLKRAMGLGDVVQFYVVAIVGLRWLATAAAAGPSALVVWVIAAAALFVPLAFAVIELSARHSEEGGIYVWTRVAFGDFAAFMVAWLYWVSNVVYVPGMLYFMIGNALFIGGERWLALSNDPAVYIVASLLGVVVAIGFNVVGLEVGKRLHNLGAWSTWAPVGLLVALGAVAVVRFGSATSFEPAALVPSTRLADLYFWSTIAFAFGGFEAASLMGEEIRDPRRDVPRAVLLAGVAIAAVYMLGTAAILVALPGEEVSGLQGIMQAIQRVAERTGMPAVTPLAAALVALGALGGTAAWLAATARLIFVVGVDRYLPPVFGRVHPRWGTPVAALVAQGVGAALFAVLGQAGASVKSAYDFLVSMGVITYFIPFLVMFAALIKVQREPLPEGALRVPGGRPATLVHALLGMATVAISIGLAVFPPGEGTQGASRILVSTGLVLAVGAAIFLRARRAPALPRAAR